MSTVGSRSLVDPKIVKQLRELYLNYFNQEVDVIHMIASQPLPKPDEKDFFKDVTFRGNAMRTQMNVVKECARGITADVEETGNRSDSKKADTANVLELVKQRLNQDGINIDEEIKANNVAEKEERGRRISKALKEKNTKKAEEEQRKMSKRDTDIKRHGRTAI
ncbi:hypothetical protein V5T82_14245 [Magnetovibrio sp. PR-2]|uniref:hypothetical protein n=1 Tax=Magnetovibrio sp. PR-2 TaxID=3120356 RepID=UPI002FCE4DE5